jgi:HEAT repeat protein
MSNSIPVLISVLNSEEVRNANKLEAQIIAGRKEEFRERMLISEQVELQERIIQTLAEIGSPAKSAVPTLIGYIQSQNSRLSLAAIEAIGAIGSSAKVATLPLKEVLKEQVKIDKAGRLRQEEFDVRQILSLEALARIGETSIAVPSLLRILQADRSLIVQERGRTTIISSQRFIIYRIGKAFNRIGKAAIPYLISELKSTIPKKKFSAVYGLSQIDSLTPEAIDLLSIVVRDDKTDLDARRLAAYALERSNIDMQWFFDQNSLVSSKKAACLTLDYFDDYTGQCISPGKNGGASLFDQIKKFFGG